MPFGQQPVCSKCAVKVSESWHRKNDGDTVCNQCWIGKDSSQNKADIVSSDTMCDSKSEIAPAEFAVENVDVDDTNVEEVMDADCKQLESGPGTRSGSIATSSVRGGKTSLKKSRGRNKKVGSFTKSAFSKGRGRRSVLKKQPSKASHMASTSVTTGHLFHNDTYYQIGDIVSTVDEDGGIYYAQIRGLLQDQYCDKSAVITWLIPTQSSPPPELGFDPLSYILGPEEELPRKLDFLEFVQHAPSEFYKLDENIKVTCEKEAGYIWTSMGAVRRTITP